MQAQRYNVLLVARLWTWPTAGHQALHLVPVRASAQHKTPLVCIAPVPPGTPAAAAGHGRVVRTRLERSRSALARYSVRWSATLRSKSFTQLSTRPWPHQAHSSITPENNSINTPFNAACTTHPLLSPRQARWCALRRGPACCAGVVRLASDSAWQARLHQASARHHAAGRRQHRGQHTAGRSVRLAGGGRAPSRQARARPPGWPTLRTPACAAARGIAAARPPPRCTAASAPPGAGLHGCPPARVGSVDVPGHSFSMVTRRAVTFTSAAKAALVCTAAPFARLRYLPPHAWQASTLHWLAQQRPRLHFQPATKSKTDSCSRAATAVWTCRRVAAAARQMLQGGASRRGRSAP